MQTNEAKVEAAARRVAKSKAKADALWAKVEAARIKYESEIGGEAKLIAAWNAYADFCDLPMVDAN